MYLPLAMDIETPKSTTRPGPPFTRRKPEDGALEPSWLTIDLGRLEQNVQGYLDATRHEGGVGTGGAMVCGVVKKNAYGLGALPVARRLVAAGCGMLAVYSAAEAQELAGAGITLPILVLMPVQRIQRTDPLYRTAVQDRLHLTLHDLRQLEQLDQAGRNLGTRLPIHLHVDTGMAREGLTVEQAGQVLARRETLLGLRVAGVMTHFATADDDPGFAEQQHERFEAALDGFGDALPNDVLIHAANSYAVFRDRRYHRHLVRPGLGLYGYAGDSLRAGPSIAEAPETLPIVRWCTRLVHIQRYPAGATVGYHRSFKLQRDSVLGVAAVGYGDGYPVALSNRGVVRVELPGHHNGFADCPVLGRVNMDQLVVDLTDAQAFVVGDPLDMLFSEAELYSDDPAAPNAIPKLAGLADTHAYELLCRLSPRIPRRYVN